MEKERIFLVFALMIVASLFLLNGCGTSNQGNQGSNQGQNNNLNQNAFSSCQASKMTIPFGNDGTYTIEIVGIESEKCHWRYSIDMPQVKQSFECYYPLDKMSNNAYNHLFGIDKTGTECISEICKEQEGLLTSYCQPA